MRTARASARWVSAISRTRAREGATTADRCQEQSASRQGKVKVSPFELTARVLPGAVTIPVATRLAPRRANGAHPRRCRCRSRSPLPKPEPATETETEARHRNRSPKPATETEARSPLPKPKPATEAEAATEPEPEARCRNRIRRAGAAAAGLPRRFSLPHAAINDQRARCIEAPKYPGPARSIESV
jgi:hypothetical protein